MINGRKDSRSRSTSPSTGDNRLHILPSPEVDPERTGKEDRQNGRSNREAGGEIKVNTVTRIWKILKGEPDPVYASTYAKIDKIAEDLRRLDE